MKITPQYITSELKRVARVKIHTPDNVGYVLAEFLLNIGTTHVELSWKPRGQRIRLNPNSIYVYPDVEDPTPIKRGHHTSAFWSALRLLGIHFGGGVGWGGHWVQASWIDKDGTIPLIVHYFHALQTRRTPRGPGTQPGDYI